MNLRLHTRLFLRWLRFYRRARTIYDLHPPFVYDFAQWVVEDRRWFYAFSHIETLREMLKRDQREIEVTDLGAGSLVKDAPRRSIGSLAQYSAVRPALGRTLFRIAHRYQPARLLELGASLGISTLYQALACRSCELTTVEGCPATAEEARKNLAQLQAGNVRLINAPFGEALPRLLEEGPLDYLYLDGDHREGASLRYFAACLERAHPGSIFVIADIHWSEAMERAWREMQRHPRVTLSVDLFHCGVLFFREEIRVRQHISLVPANWKPWRKGFF